MIKLLLSVAIVGGTSTAGWLLARDLKRRPEELRSLQTAVRFLQTEVDFRQSAIPEALSRVAALSSWPAGRLFSRAAEYLNQGEAADVQSAMTVAMEEVFRHTALAPSDAELIIDLASSLGRSHREDQIRHLTVCLERLAAAEREAREVARNNVRMFTYLGVLSGTAIVLLVV